MKILTPAHPSIATTKIIGGIALITAATHITIPLQPVPITLQTLAILLIALTYTAKESIATILGYITIGILGAPVFAGGKFGILAMTGPTAGYIVGFALASITIAITRHFLPQKNIFTLATHALLGLIAIFTPGILWLSQFLGMGQALLVGLTPFILPEIIKAGLLVVILQIIKAK